MWCNDQEQHFNILDFKLSPCFECRIFSFGLFPGVGSLNANVSEHSVCSNFIGHTPSHTLTHGLFVDRCLHNLFSLPAPTPTTSSRGTQAIFRTFSRTIPHFLNRCHISYLLAYEDGTDRVFRNDAGQSPRRQHKTMFCC
jgi:hypothetical protein